MSWKLLDMEKLFEATVAANAGPFTVPFPGLLRAKLPWDDKRDYEIATTEFNKLLRKANEKKK